MTQNKNFAYAYEMIPAWRPYFVPGPETSNAVMTALLLHDLNNPMHAGHPEMPLANPQQIFSMGGFHGGPWRAARSSTCETRSAIGWARLVSQDLSACNLVDEPRTSRRGSRR